MTTLYAPNATITITHAPLQGGRENHGNLKTGTQLYCRVMPKTIRIYGPEIQTHRKTWFSDRGITYTINLVNMPLFSTVVSPPPPTTPKFAVPPNILNSLFDMSGQLGKSIDCPICMEELNERNVTVTSCGHMYCVTCLDIWKNAEKQKQKQKWECCVCRERHAY